jgi:hypothetical protein
MHAAQDSDPEDPRRGTIDVRTAGGPRPQPVKISTIMRKITDFSADHEP